MVVLVALGGSPGGPRGSKIWNLSGIQFKSLSTASKQNFDDVERYKISVSYLQKYGFYGLGVVLVSLGGAPGGLEAPKVWNLPGIHFVSLSIASIQNFSFLSPKI